MKLSVILPTIGRACLKQTLLSIDSSGFIPDHDQLIVVADGCKAGELAWEQMSAVWALQTLRETVEMPPVKHAGYGRLTILDHGPHKDWGHTPRNEVMADATGDWILSIDDDDGYRPRALDAVRAALTETGRRVPHVFRMRWRGSKYLWETKEIRQCNVSTQMICVPNDPARLGKWGSRYQGDLDFLTSTVALYNGEVVWREEIIVDYCCW